MTTETAVTTNNADKTLETVLINIIDKVTSGVDKAIEFGSEQLPDIVEQLILFNTVQMIFLVLLGPVSVFAFVKLMRWIIKNTKVDRWNNWGIDRIFPCVAGTMTCVALCIVSIVNLFSLIKITLAPKIWLIEYAAGLVK